MHISDRQIRLLQDWPCAVHQCKLDWVYGKCHVHCTCINIIQCKYIYTSIHRVSYRGVGTRDFPPPPPQSPVFPPKNFEIDKVNNQCNEVQIRC